MLKVVFSEVTHRFHGLAIPNLDNLRMELRIYVDENRLKVHVAKRIYPT